MKNDNMELLFLSATGIELVMGLLFQCNIDIPYSRYILWILFGVYLLVAARQILEKRDTDKIVMLLIAEIIGVLVYANTGINTWVKAPVYVYALSGVSKKKYCKMSFAIIVLVSVTVCILNAFWGIGNMYNSDDIIRGINGKRYSFGYAHPNRFMGILIMAISFFLLIYSSKISLKGYVALAAYMLTDSRTSVIIGEFIIAGCYIVEREKKMPDMVPSILIMLFSLVLFSTTLISCLAALQVEDTTVYIIDKLITGRIEQLGIYTDSAEYALAYAQNWKMFGNCMNQNTYDMGYVGLFYYYGIIPAVCDLVFMMYCAIKAWKNDRAVELVIMIGAIVFLFMESLYISNYLPLHFSMIVCAIQLGSEQSDLYKVKTDAFSNLRFHLPRRLHFRVQQKKH